MKSFAADTRLFANRRFAGDRNEACRFFELFPDNAIIVDIGNYPVVRSKTSSEVYGYIINFKCVTSEEIEKKRIKYQMI